MRSHNDDDRRRRHDSSGHFKLDSRAGASFFYFHWSIPMVMYLLLFLQWLRALRGFQCDLAVRFGRASIEIKVKNARRK